MNRIYLFLLALTVATTASAADYYLKWSKYNNWEKVPMQQIANASDGAKQYMAVVVPTDGGGGSMQFTNENDSRYWGATDGWWLFPGMDYPATGKYLSTWDNGNGTNITTGGEAAKESSDFFQKGKKYVFYLKDYGNNNLRLYVNNTLYDNYYLYCDMNRWSALKNAGQPVSITDLTGNDLTSVLWPEGAPKYYSVDELNAKWRFTDVAQNELPAAIRDENGPWMKLDMNQVTDQDGKRVMCGQFKITSGDFEGADNFGFDADVNDDNSLKDSKAYLIDGLVEANKLYDKVSHKAGLRNFILADNYLTNATIYLQPISNKLYISTANGDADVHHPYVYYAVYNKNDFGQPQSAKISDLSQVNYYANSEGFNNTANGEMNPGGRYDWEKVTTIDGEPIVYDGIEYAYVYRKRILPSASHRFPVPFNISLTGYTGTQFEAQQVDCKDLWFVEGEVNLHFRYADGRQPSWVACNAFTRQFDNLGVVSGYTYAWGGAENKWQKMTAPAEVEGGDGYLWYNTKESLPRKYSSAAFAIFMTSEGAVYPIDGNKANSTERATVAIKGHDLFYVVPVPDPDIHILYTHLNGTYQLGSEAAAHPLQIQAEFFDEDGSLDTTYNDESTKYFFAVYKAGAANPVATTGDFRFEPYFDGFQPVEAGFYTVVVKVMKDGKVYSASDIYPVYPAN